MYLHAHEPTDPIGSSLCLVAQVDVYSVQVQALIDLVLLPA